MSVFDLNLEGWRYAETLFGDTLQRVALRELGDASRWAELAWINDLIPPYLTDDPTQSGAQVLLNGGALIIPSATQVTTATDPALVFESDCALTDGLLSIDDSGDIAVVSGEANLRQQLRNRVGTRNGGLMFHPDYGCLVRRLIGGLTGRKSGLLAAHYVRLSLSQDYRVQDVLSCTAEVVGDRISVTARVQPISGRPIDLTLSA